jgi:hypothetical protein
MTDYYPDMYCQEVWDLGRSIMFFNNWLLNSYYNVCDPKLTRGLYILISKYINNFSSDEEDYESDLFIYYNQNRFNNFVTSAYDIIEQMPRRDEVSEYFEKILENLRILNNYLESPQGQEKDWFKIHWFYQSWVNSQIWTIQELNNNIPDIISTTSQPPSQPP